MENSRTCQICNVSVHRALIQKDIRSKKDKIVPEWLFKEEQTPIKNKVKKVLKPKTLKQLARENIVINDKELDRESAKT